MTKHKVEMPTPVSECLLNFWLLLQKHSCRILEKLIYFYTNIQLLYDFKTVRDVAQK